MSDESFEQFRQLVLQDRALQERLRVTSNHEAFLVMAVSLGDELGFTFTSQDVEDALKTNRRAWLERWIQ